MTSIKKTTKTLIGTSMALGVGATALGIVGQGNIADKAIKPATGMIGPMASAGMGMGILSMINDETKKLNKKRK